MKKNTDILLTLILYNFLFWIVISILFKTQSYLMQSGFTDYLLQLSPTMKLFSGLLSFISFLLIPTLIYSFFKLLVLAKVKCFFKKTKTPFKLFLRFYINNVIIFTFFNLLSGIWLIVSLGVNKTWFPVYIVLTYFPLCFFAYSFINIFHSLIIKEEHTKVLRKALNLTFRNIKTYIPFLIINIPILIIYSLLSWGIVTVLINLKITTIDNFQENLFLQLSFYAVIIFLLIFNQLYFYQTIVGHSPD